MKRIAFWTILCLISITVSLLVLEIGLRGSGYGGQITEAGLYFPPSEGWGFFPQKADYRDVKKTIKNIEQLASGDLKDQIYLNGHYHPLKKPEGTKRVLFVGDSGLFGSGAPWRSTFSYRLFENLKDQGVEILNSGLPGASATQVLSTLSVSLLKLQPDSVVFVFFLDNDVLDILRDPYIDRWSKVLAGWPSGGIWDSLAIMNFLKIQYANRRVDLNTVDYDKKDLQKIDYKTFERLNPNTCRGRYSFYLKEPVAEVNQAWNFLRGQIMATRLKLKELGVPFHILVFPSITTVSEKFAFLRDDFEGTCVKEGLQINDDQVAHWVPQRKYREICKDLKLSCMDPTQDIKGVVGREFFKEGDDHASVQGHSFLFDFLMKNKHVWLP